MGFQFSVKRRTADAEFLGDIGNPPPDSSYTVRTGWDASLRGRLGVLVTPGLLLYGTGGAAWIDTEITSSCGPTTCFPGTVLPQRGTNPLKVTQWIQNNTVSGPTLDRLGFFDVYGSAWFAAVYILLFVSLVGCVIPRMGQHWRAMTAPPPPAPPYLPVLENPPAPPHARSSPPGSPVASGPGSSPRCAVRCRG